MVVFCDRFWWLRRRLRVTEGQLETEVGEAVEKGVN
jgi:hypothetical protein